jgi:hypothetical protein
VTGNPGSDRPGPGAGQERRSDSAGPPAGLCNACVHQQLVPNTRGSVFSLCQRSRTEPNRFPRYPRLPVTECPGFSQRP